MTTTPTVSVPVEPTREMWAAGGTAACQAANQHHDKVVEGVWSAMVAAAPALTARHEAPFSEDEARRKLIECIDQWDSEMEYDAEDRVCLADDILHAFNGPPVVSHEAPAEGAGERVSRLRDALMRMIEHFERVDAPEADKAVIQYASKTWAGVKDGTVRSAPEASPQVEAVEDDELIERGLRTVRAYDTVRYLRDALSATTARLAGYDWNADPDAITRLQGDAFAAAGRVFSDLNAAVAAHPEIDLLECQTCSGTGKIEEEAKTEGANQHSACVRTCEDCDGCGFSPDEVPSALYTHPQPAQTSGVGAWVVRSPNGNVRYWSRDEALTKRNAAKWGLEARYEALGPSPFRPSEGEVGDALSEVSKRIPDTILHGNSFGHEGFYPHVAVKTLVAAVYSGLSSSSSITATQPDRGVEGAYGGLREALERIADEAPYRSGYCQSDIAYAPTLTAEEMQAVARAALAAGESGE